MERFDLIAIGGGTAGLVSAAGGAALGLKTALVERDALGGDCLWTGCVPSKALIASARLAQAMRHAGSLGLVGASPAHAFSEVMRRAREARATVARHDDPDRFRKLGVEVVFGRAELRAPDVVDVNGRRFRAKRIVIATGAEPTVPPIPGLAEVPYLTHATAFEQDSLPRSMVMVGGGPLGLEFAHAYQRLGAEVTVIEMLPEVLPEEDVDVAAVVRGVLEADGVAVHTDTRVERVERTDSGRIGVTAQTADGGQLAFTCDCVFVATGRRPTAEALGLEAVGVAVDGGAVRVDRSLQSTVGGVWAAGDVTGGPQFTHVAEYHAKLVLRNAVFPFRSHVDYSAVPAVTYTDPEVARVGLTEAEARERYGDVSVYQYPFAHLDRAIVDGRTVGFVKAVTRRRGRLVGATIVGAGAGDLLMPFVLAMQRGIPLPKLSQMVFPYPTMAEGIKRTADGYYREKLSGSAGAWLRRVVRWLT